MAKKYENFDRDIAIFKDYLDKLAYNDIADKYKLSVSRLRQIIKAVAGKLRVFIARSNLPRPENWNTYTYNWALQDFLKQKDYWLDVIDQYVSHISKLRKIN